MLRLSFLTHSALASAVISACAAFVAVLGLSFGYVADGVSSRVRAVIEGPSSNKPGRKLSRVEQWLEAQQSAARDTMAPIGGEPPPSALDAAGGAYADMQYHVRHAATLAAAMDKSEDATAVTAVTIEPVISVSKQASADPELAVRELKALRITAPSRRRVSLAANQARVPARKVELKSKRHRAPLPAMALKTLPPPVAKAASMRVRIADSPAEIILRSLSGTGQG